MKSLRTVLFALVVLPLAACGGEEVTSTPAATMSPVVQRAPVPDAVVEPVTSTAPTTYASALELGQRLVAKGDVVRAKEMFEAAAKLDKKKSEPHIELARMFITNGERASAIKSATKAVKLAPDSSQAYNTLGRAELARYGYEAAIQAFEKAAELNPDNVWAWNNLGFVHLERKDYRKAVAALTEATQRPGATGFMFNNLGTALEQVDELEDARTAYEEGGKLGSTVAKASRKRLEGVDTIVGMERVPDEKSYELREEMPADEVVDETSADEPAVQVPDAEVPVVGPASPI